MCASTSDRQVVREQLERFGRGEAAWEEIVGFVAGFSGWDRCDAASPWTVVVGAWVDGWLTEAQLRELYRHARGEDATTIDLTAPEPAEQDADAPRAG